jgi:hypothetical protein
MDLSTPGFLLLQETISKAQHNKIMNLIKTKVKKFVLAQNYEDESLKVLYDLAE